MKPKLISLYIAIAMLAACSTATQYGDAPPGLSASKKPLEKAAGIGSPLDTFANGLLSLTKTGSFDPKKGEILSKRGDRALNPSRDTTLRITSDANAACTSQAAASIFQQAISPTGTCAAIAFQPSVKPTQGLRKILAQAVAECETAEGELNSAKEDDGAVTKGVGSFSSQEGKTRGKGSTNTESAMGTTERKKAARGIMDVCSKARVSQYASAWKVNSATGSATVIDTKTGQEAEDIFAN